MGNKLYITASEVGDFVFCKRGWWLKINGLIRDNYQMESGRIGHDALARNVKAADKRVVVSFFIFVITAIVLIVLFIIRMVLKAL